MRAVFDIETNGKLDVLDELHCIVIKDIDTNEVYSCAKRAGFLTIEEGLDILLNAEVLIGHNIICFDLPALKKLYPWFSPHAKIRDTLNIARLIYTNTFGIDIKTRVPKEYKNKQSLAAWGHRLGLFKDSFGDTTNWSKWSIDMQKYCERDVEVNTKLFRHFEEFNYSEEAIDIECEFQKIIFDQEQNGLYLDVVKAKKHYDDLVRELAPITKELLIAHPGVIHKQKFIPKRNNLVKGYVAGVPYWKEKFIEFNPNSRIQCINMLKEKYGWEPTETTDKGNPKLDTDVLSELCFPEAKLLGKYFDVKKILGRIGDGDNAFLKIHNEGKISARMVTNGAVTGRATHKGISNIPRVTSFFGKEMRELFHSGDDWLVGADAGQLELRLLAHYLYKYDGGRYAEIVNTGDVHTVNQEDAGLPTRDNAKTFIYAFIYGAGNAKLGSIVEPEGTKEAQLRTGKGIRNKFFEKNRAIERLVSDVQKASRRGWLKGLDGRKILVRSEHSALNFILQSAGAIIMKKANIIFWDLAKRDGLDKEMTQAIQYHDEIQIRVKKEELAKQAGDLLCEAISDAGIYFNLKCPLTADYKVGKNWAETH